MLKPVHTDDYIQRLLQKSATVAEFRNCRRRLAVFGDSRRFRRQSHFSATVWTGLYIHEVERNRMVTMLCPQILYVTVDVLWRGERLET